MIDARRKREDQPPPFLGIEAIDRPAAPRFLSGPITIYALVDPRTNDVRYVGKTVEPERRHRRHCERPGNDGLRHWVWKLAGKGLAPTMVILGRCEDQEWEAAERAWIACFRLNGRLYNIHEGGLRR